MIEGSKVLESYQLFEDWLNGDKEKLEKTLKVLKNSNGAEFDDYEEVNLALAQFIHSGSGEPFAQILGTHFLAFSNWNIDPNFQREFWILVFKGKTNFLEEKGLDLEDISLEKEMANDERSKIG